VQDAAQLKREFPGNLPATWENTGNSVLPSQHPMGVTDQGATEPTEHMDQNKQKTNERNQFSLSLRRETHLIGIHLTDTYNKECTLDQNQALQHEEQNSSHEQLRNEEKTLRRESKSSHQIVEYCIVNKEGNDVGKNLPNTET
jgi:hypothetical protein